MGIRPEDLHVAGDADPAGLTFNSKVEVVEQLGSEILLDVRVGEDTMVAAVDPTTRAKVQDSCGSPSIPSGCTSSTPRPRRRFDVNAYGVRPLARASWGQTPRPIVR